MCGWLRERLAATLRAVDAICYVGVRNEQEVATVTKHSGSNTVWIAGGNVGFARSLGSSSKSVTTAKDAIFLEVQISATKGGAPKSIVLPFTTESQEANRWATALNL